MAVQIPPEITPVPTPAIQRNDRATFSNRVDAFLNWLVSARGQFSAVATNAYQNAVEAMGFANSAAADRVQTGLDRTQTGADRVKTGEDRLASAASAAVAAMAAAFSDVNYFIRNAADATKRLRFDLAGFTTGITRVITIPNKNGTMAMLDDAGVGYLGEITLASPAANIDFLTIFNGGQHDRFLITIQKAGASVAGNSIAIRYAVGGVVDSANNYQVTVYGATFGSAASQLQVGIGSTNPNMHAEFTLDNNDLGNIKASHSCSPITSSGELYRGSYFSSAPTVLSGFRVFATNGSNLLAGTTVRVYGFRKT